jgi:hypothetical protein
VNDYLSIAQSIFNVLVKEEMLEEKIFDDLKNVKEKEKEKLRLMRLKSYLEP